MISLQICKLSTKQQLMTALEMGRRKELKDKKHSKSHRINSAQKTTENLKSKSIKQFILEAEARMPAFPSHFVMASSPRKHWMCVCFSEYFLS